MFSCGNPYRPLQGKLGLEAQFKVVTKSHGPPSKVCGLGSTFAA